MIFKNSKWIYLYIILFGYDIFNVLIKLFWRFKCKIINMGLDENQY